MPLPFPGMDPYLEGNLWTTFHFAFGAELVRQLAPQLHPRYVTLPMEYIEMNDVAIPTNHLPPEMSIEIRDTANHQLVTAIEILSPTNKRGDGRLEYLTKRRRILMSTVPIC